MSNIQQFTKKARTLVLCFDGTSNEYSAENTNVVNFFSLLKKDDFDEQLCYYQAGIGTFFAPGVVSPFFEWCAKILDEAFAWYLNAHVMDGYRFLMENYRVGDKICLFGFSRGAYTARALAGMLYKVGLLPRDNQEQITFAFKMYQRDDTALAAGFKKTFCQDVKVEFLGVWETVSSVGVVMAKSLPFTSSNEAIKTFRHALALDEHRTKFRPNLYQRPAPNSDNAAEVSSTSKGTSPTKSRGLFRWTSGRRNSDPDGKNSISKSSDSTPDVLEVWFCGCHSDVGGGSVPDDTAQNLSNIPLRWMVREVIASGCPIIFNQEPLDALMLPKSTNDTPAIEADMDAADAVAPIHDSLVELPIWWVLEILPIKYNWQDLKGVWQSSYKPNLGRGRAILDPHPNFHTSVKDRMDTAALAYKPKATWTSGSEVYVQ
ncbi:hypothetical protein C8J56DRAFT_912301 [Mycena floridula]|nr:hypothetical protein C8J56DRAFT_912301 [Mycena floridula]